MLEEIIMNLTSDEDLFSLLIVFGMGGVIAIVAIVFGTIRKISINGEREESRREIAAYVAEGSMSPEDGERLLKAAPGKDA